MLHVNELVYRVGGRTLLDRANLSIPAGQRVGLVGPNGSGKSTLLRLIAGEFSPDSGRISVAGRARTGLVAQETPDGPASLIDFVLAADRERGALLARLDATRDATAIAEVHDHLARIEAHSAPARAAAILAGLGFDDAAQARPLRDFSGGWRMRVALGVMLFLRPELLLLDEPTNHLDLEASLWLESYLKTYAGTVLLVSHDRDLLNRVPQRIVHLQGGKLTSYRDTYNAFERARREALAFEVKERAKQAAERLRIEAFIDRFRAKATKARQAQSRLKALERMAPVAAFGTDEAVHLSFPEIEPVAPPLITMDSVAAGYEVARPVLKGLSLRIDPDDRIALLGANGNGKSTLARLLARRIAPMAGEMRAAPKAGVGYFSQDQADELDHGRTALDHLAARDRRAPEQHHRDHLGRFGFGKVKAETVVRDLSGGERARLLFALMSRANPHILVLDEPTNHLDVAARESLIQAINAFPGAVVLISHDSHLIELIADRLWLVAGGTCRPFEGDLDDYRVLLLDQRRAAGERAETRQATRPKRRDERRQAAEARALSAPLRRAVTEAEAAINRLAKRKTEIEVRLADPALYGGRSDEITKLRMQLAAIERDLEEAEGAWFAAQHALEEGIG